MAASIDLTSLAALKRYLGVTGTSDDTWLGELIDEVSEAIEQHCNRKFKGQEYTEYHDGEDCPDGRIIVDNPPLHDGSDNLIRTQTQIAANIEVWDDVDNAWDTATQQVDSTNLHVRNAEAGIIQSDQALFDGSGNVKVVYTGGFATLPTNLDLAAKRWIAAIYNQAKSAADGLRSETEAGASATYDLSEMPANVERLLSKYLRRQL